MRDEYGRHLPLAGEIRDEIHHRLLCRHVQAGRRLVGDQQPRLAGDCDGDHDALTHAAGQLERVGVVAPLRIVDAHELQQIDRLTLGVVRGSLRMADQHVLDLPPDLPDGIECCARILKDHRDLAASQIQHRLLARILNGYAGKADATLRDATSAIEDAHHGVGRHRLAGARFADDADGLAFVDSEVHLAHRRDCAVARGEFDCQIGHIEERLLRAHAQVLRWGSTMSRRPSPSRLKVNTASINASPGNSATHHSPEMM